MEAWEDFYLRFGINIGLVHFNTEESSPTSPTNPNNPVAVNEKFMKPNFDMGFMMRYRAFYLGIGLYFLSEPTFKFFTIGVENRMYRTANITSGYTIPLGETFSLEPSTMISFLAGKSTTTGGSGLNRFRPYVDLTLRGNYNNLAYLGASYKINDNPSAVSTGGGFSWAIVGGVRLAETYQLSAAWHIPKKNTNNTARYSLNLSFFLRNSDLDE